MKIDNNFGKTEMGLHYAVLMEEIIVEDAFRKYFIKFSTFFVFFSFPVNSLMIIEIMF